MVPQKDLIHMVVTNPLRGTLGDFILLLDEVSD